jgi:hypothetical protein
MSQSTDGPSGTKGFAALLESLEPRELRSVLSLLCIGGARAVTRDWAAWTVAERVIFNGRVLLLCMDKLNDRELAEVVNIGVQIEDLHGFTDDQEALGQMCERVETLALQLLLNVDDKG